MGYFGLLVKLEQNKFLPSNLPVVSILIYHSSKDL